MKVKLKNPEKKIWSPQHAGLITGSEVFEVPDVPYWRRKIKAGDMVRADETPKLGGPLKAKDPEAKREELPTLKK